MSIEEDMTRIQNYLNKLLDPYKGLQKEIYILAISRFVNALGALIFPFMTLILREKIGLDEFQTGMYTAAAGLLFIPAGLLGGRIADFFGRKQTIIIFEIIGMMTYVICLFIEPSMLMVYIFMLTAFSFGVAGPAHDAMIADFSSDKEREGAFSLMYLGFNLGFAFSMILAGLLFANHLKLMFLIDAITAMFALILIGFFVKDHYVNKEESNPGNNRVIDVVTEEQSMVIDEQELNHYATSPAIQKDLEKSHTGNIIQVLKERPILIEFTLLMFIYRLVYSQWSFLMPLHTVELYGQQAGGALYGSLGTINALVVVFLTALITKIFFKVTSINRIVIAGLFLSIGFGVLGFNASPFMFYLSVVVFTIGEIIEAISTMPYIMNHTPESHRGRMSAIIMTVMGVGFSTGPILLGLILKYSTYSVSWFFTGGLGLIGVLGMLNLSRKEV